MHSGPVAVTDYKKAIVLFPCLAIRRFVCRRGNPVEFCFYNLTNFQRVSNGIVQKIDDRKEVMTDARSCWNFN